MYSCTKKLVALEHVDIRIYIEIYQILFCSDAKNGRSTDQSGKGGVPINQVREGYRSIR